jgi:hypothetical protein
MAQEANNPGTGSSVIGDSSVPGQPVAGENSEVARQMAVLTGCIDAAKRFAGEPGSQISPGQVDTAVGHMLSAVGYLFEDATAPFAPGAENLILNLGQYLSGLNPKVSEELTKLGNAIMEADEETIQSITTDAGVVFATIPEDATIYNSLRDGNINLPQLQKWLLNAPVRGKVS